MAQVSPTPSSARRYDIDWLRVLAVLLLVPFHVALTFVLNPNSVVYIKDTVNSEFLDRFAGFLAQFQMLLLFVIAGEAAFFALRKRSAGQFTGERVLRLLVPLLFGVAVLLPPMTYLWRVSVGAAPDFLTHYLGFFTLGDITGRDGSFTPAHLWFILFLFFFSLLALPLFLLLRRPGSRAFLRALAGFFEKRLALWLLAVPLALAAAANILGAQNPLYYLLLFIIGYFLATDERCQKAIDRDAPIALVVALALEVLRQTWHPQFAEGSLPWALHGIAFHLGRLTLTLAILGYGHRLLNRAGPVFHYLVETSYPFYILHLPVATLVGYFIVRLQAVVAVKYLLIVILATGLTFLLCEIVRRIPALRFLFGMKQIRKAVPVAVPAPAH